MIRFQAEAVQELDDSARWYEGQRSGLAAEFLGCIQDALDDIERSPDGSLAAGGDLRRVLVSRFPFSIYFRREDDLIRIFAIAHNRRRPAYWHHRLS